MVDVGGAANRVAAACLSIHVSMYTCNSNVSLAQMKVMVQQLWILGQHPQRCSIAGIDTNTGLLDRGQWN